MGYPLVSVIIPTYNRALILNETIQSVLQQTHRELEIIVVDDGSTDNTGRLIEKINDKRLFYLYKENRGLASARNEGIKKSKGEYIAFLDSDDRWLPSKIEKQIEVFKNSRLKPGVVYCGVRYIDENGAKIREEKLPAYRGNIFLELLGSRRNAVLGAGSTILVKKECFKECGLLNENLSYRIDLEMLIRIAKKFAFDYAAEVLSEIRIHNTRMSSDVDNIIKGREMLFEKIYSDLKNHRRILAKYYYQTALLYLKKGDIIKHREYIVKSVKSFPLIRAVKALWKH
ncbi:MAG: glycosyltransferase [Candidatus Ratteibacteria bacterium]|nr:glycosyltransferase [Candidatus Ratteibacteria bacterium]